MEATASFLKLARVAKTFEPEVFRIQFNALPSAQEVADMQITYLKIDGVEAKLNAAPKGPRERRMDDHLRGSQEDSDAEDKD